MGSIIAILLFSLSLITCLLLKFSVVYALVIGYIIFMNYARTLATLALVEC
ncbi:hypothetical protein HMPREF9942_00519 [Fusobacterium animalis F0419]|uniref:Uncharacterized protein n=1 Tax=Fusobacterium animalis F0419 TaxID=999414 RepID=H1HDG8_9FUSO|nr:hypothetical protein [Fusobacterium animalis]EHO78862.1 hypothetical protein HMPREF9942_00519 [Fusobacterium animalis F0419]